MQNIHIPNSVTSIGDGILVDCKSLKEIDLPNSITAVGDNTFWGCSALQTFDIPNSVTSIGKNAFRDCSSLKNIDIPNSITSIGGRAFYNCSALQSIDIPENVTTIGDYAFSRCDSLKAIEVAENNLHYTSVDGVLFNKDMTTILRYPKRKEGKQYTIPSSVTTIGVNAFNFTYLQEIEIPDGVQTIGTGAFDCSTNLKDISIPASVTSIGRNIYMGDTCIVSGGNPLESIHIRIMDIEKCDIDEKAFERIDFEKCTLYIPSGTRWAYRHHPAFSGFKNIETMRYK